MIERECPCCGRLNWLLFETVDGLACPACTKYSGTGRTEPASWRHNATRGAAGREWPGRPAAEGDGGAEHGGAGREP